MITKVSEITVDDLQSYLRLSEMTEKDKRYLETILNVAINFIKNNTGADDKVLDENADFIIAVYVLCEDMYDTRSYYVSEGNVNKVVQTILDMHTRILL